MSECPIHKAGHHDWYTLEARIEGRDSSETYVVEQCQLCNDLRLNFAPEVVEEVGRDT